MDDADRLVHAWFEDLFSDGDLPVADEILDADVDYHGPESLSPGEVTGIEEIKRYVSIYREAFPDLRYTVEDTFRAGDRLCVRWSVVGTHRSDLFGIEPTGEVFAEEGISVFVVEDGKITEVWAAWDTLAMAQELDVIPPIELLDE